MSAQIKLVLDTFRQNRIAPVFSMVGDYGAREIRAIITCDGDPHAVPVTAEVTINAKRPDGQEKRFPGAANGDGSVTVPITQWMLERRGGVECSISAVGIGTKLTTTPITLTALQTPTGEDISPDDPEYDLLAQVLAGEAERVAAEKTRVVNERTRVDAEAGRAENEAQREASEDVRRTNETARVNAEQNRADTFAGWVSDMGQLGNFNARLTNVESAIYGDLAREVVDDSVAHVKDVPAAAKPYARVDMIGGMTRKCANLLRRPYNETSDTVTLSGVTFTVNFDGSVTANGTATNSIYFALNYVKFKAGTSYAISGTKGGKFNVYVDNVGSGVVTPEQDITAQAYINVSTGTVLNNETCYPQVEIGTVATEYEPYFEGLRSAPVTEIESVGANLWNFDNGKHALTSGVSLTLDDGHFEVQVKTSAAAEVSSLTWLPHTTVRLRAGKYTVSLNNYKGDLGVLYIKDTETSANLIEPFNTENQSRTFTIDRETDVAFGIYYYFASAANGTFSGDMMLNRGTTAQPYTPYVKHTLPIPAEVRAKPWYGIGLPGVPNAIRYNEDGSRSGDVKCGVDVFDGSDDEPWTLYNTNLYTSALDKIAKHGTAPVSDCAYTVWIGGGTNALGIETEGDFDVDTWRAYLASNPITIVYELATPTTEDISDILPADNYIGVEGGGTLTMVNEYGYDVPSEVVFVTKEVTE